MGIEFIERESRMRNNKEKHDLKGFSLGITRQNVPNRPDLYRTIYSPDAR